MSLVEHIDHENRIARFQQPAYTTYTAIHEDGETRVQLQSYGSDDRVKKNSASQVMQFNKESAIELVRILDKEFGLHLENLDQEKDDCHNVSSNSMPKLFLYIEFDYLQDALNSVAS